MRLPDRVAYREALHAPRIAFPDPPLRDGRARLNMQQQPVAASGAFAITFDLQVGGARYAVRCFTQQGDHLQQRYAAVADFIRSSRSQFLVDVNYLPAGIRVEGQTWPVVVMPWIDGSCLNDWIEDNLTRPAELERVRRNIDAAVTDLRQRQAAHGDLQHGNILVGRDGSIQLIDYDGMYLPALSRYGAAERGHRNYQHPERGDGFDASLDAFAAYVVDLSISAVATQRDLWSRFNHGDNLIFQTQDFVDPTNAEVFGLLARIPSLAARAERLRLACLAPFAQVPMVLSGAVTPNVARVRAPATPLASAPLVLDAIKRADLLAHDGEEVTVIGRIITVKTLTGRHGGLYSLVNFGDHRQGAFTVVLWEKTRRAVVRNLGEPETLVGSYVQVTGHLSSFQSAKNRPLTPQIDLRHARSLRTVTASQAAVLLAQAAARTPTATAPRPTRHAPTTPQSATPQAAAVRAMPAAAAAVKATPAATGSQLEHRLARLYASAGFASRVTPAAGAPTTARHAATAPTPPTARTPPTASTPTAPAGSRPAATKAAPQASPPPTAAPASAPPVGRRKQIYPQVHPFVGAGRQLPRSVPAPLRRLPFFAHHTAETWHVVSLVGAGGALFILLLACLLGRTQQTVIAMLMTPLVALGGAAGVIYGFAAMLIPPPSRPARLRVRSMGLAGALVSLPILAITLLIWFGTVVG